MALLFPCWNASTRLPLHFTILYDLQFPNKDISFSFKISKHPCLRECPYLLLVEVTLGNKVYRNKNMTV